MTINVGNAFWYKWVNGDICVMYIRYPFSNFPEFTAEQQKYKVAKLAYSLRSHYLISKV